MITFIYILISFIRTNTIITIIHTVIIYYYYFYQYDNLYNILYFYAYNRQVSYFSSEY